MKTKLTQYFFIFIFIFILLFLFPLADLLTNQVNAQIFLGPSAGLSLQFAEFDETIQNSTTTLDHNNTIYGAEIGGRAGITLLGIMAGVTGAIRWSHWDGDRADGKSYFLYNSKGYDSTMRMKRWGPMGGLTAFDGNLVFWGEYYPEVKSDLYYADSETSNVFRDRDILTGTGMGIGIGSQKDKGFAGLMYQRFTYTQLKRDGIVYNLPSSTITQIREHGLIFIFGAHLDLFNFLRK